MEDTFKKFGDCVILGGTTGSGGFWETMRDEIKSGTKISEIVEQAPRSAHVMKGITTLLYYIKPPPVTRQVLNLCLWGASGVGKTKWVLDNFDADDVYFKDKTPWWDGYVDQKVVVWDDFYGEHKVGSMLRYLDIYRMQAEVKGGYVWLRHNYNIFTSNEPPENWYSTVFSTQHDVKRAFQRRLPACNCQEIRENENPKNLDNWDFQYLRKDPDAHAMGGLPPPQTPPLGFKPARTEDDEEETADSSPLCWE